MYTSICMSTSAKIPANRLKKARKKLGFTQLQLAKQLGISTNHYARIERGEVVTSITLLRKITKTLNVKAKDVVSL